MTEAQKLGMVDFRDRGTGLLSTAQEQREGVTRPGPPPLRRTYFFAVDSRFMVP